MMIRNTHTQRKLAVAIVMLVIAILHFEAVARKGSRRFTPRTPRTSPQHSDPNFWDEERKHWDLVLQAWNPQLTRAQRYQAGDRMYQFASQLPSLLVYPNYPVYRLEQRGKPARVEGGVLYLGFVIRTNDLYNILGNAKADFITRKLQGDGFDSLLGGQWNFFVHGNRRWSSRYQSGLVYPAAYYAISAKHGRRLAELIYEELTDEETNRQTRHNLKVVGLGTTSRLPNVPIASSGSIRIEGTDDETFTANEYFDSSWSLSSSFKLDENPRCIFYEQARWGGECRVEAIVFVYLKRLGAIGVKVLTEFYEGSTEGSTDREDYDEIDFEIYYPPARGFYGATVSRSIDLYNSETGGGDTAKVTIHLSAAMSW